MESFKLSGQSAPESSGETKKCHECMAEIPKEATKCSHCGTKQKGTYGATHIILGLFVLFIIFQFIPFGDDVWEDFDKVGTEPQQTTHTTNTKYFTTEAQLKAHVIDEERNIQVVDVQYALARLIDQPIYDYPFAAIANPEGDGYLAVIETKVGKALFLVSYSALNETSQTALSQSILAINGTAKNISDLQFAAGYDPADVIQWIDESVQ